MRNLLVAAGVVIAGALFLFASGTLYVVDEREQVVITRFGKPFEKPIVDAGLHWKMPFIDRKNSFDKRILQWDGAQKDMQTKEKRNIYIDTFARWRIVDPLLFYQSLRNEISAQSRLDDIIDGATRNVIASMNLIEAVRSSSRAFVTSEFSVEITDKEILREIKFGREEIVSLILANSAPKLKEFGIALEDVQIKRINYVESVQRTIYDRMIAERKRAAEQFRSEGRGEKAKIEGQLERDLLQIQSEAKRTSQEIRGKADRQALQILARAYNRDPEFFAFYQTLQTYPESIKEDNQIIFSTDNDYIKYLKKIRP